MRANYLNAFTMWVLKPSTWHYFVATTANRDSRPLVFALQQPTWTGGQSYDFPNWLLACSTWAATWFDGEPEVSYLCSSKKRLTMQQLGAPETAAERRTFERTAAAVADGELRTRRPSGVSRSAPTPWPQRPGTGRRPQAMVIQKMLARGQADMAPKGWLDRLRSDWLEERARVELELRRGNSRGGQCSWPLCRRKRQRSLLGVCSVHAPVVLELFPATAANYATPMLCRAPSWSYRYRLVDGVRPSYSSGMRSAVSWLPYNRDLLARHRNCLGRQFLLSWGTAVAHRRVQPDDPVYFKDIRPRAVALQVTDVPDLDKLVGERRDHKGLVYNPWTNPLGDWPAYPRVSLLDDFPRVGMRQRLHDFGVAHGPVHYDSSTGEIGSVLIPSWTTAQAMASLAITQKLRQKLSREDSTFFGPAYGVTELGLYPPARLLNQPNLYRYARVRWAEVPTSRESLTVLADKLSASGRPGVAAMLRYQLNTLPPAKLEGGDYPLNDDD